MNLTESLLKAESAGDTCISESDVKKLKVSYSKYADRDIVAVKKVDDRYFSLEKYNELEKNIAQNLCNILSCKSSEIPSRNAIDSILAVLDEKGTLDPHQRDAVYMACENQVMILTGGPGTGKTFTVNMICKTLMQLYPHKTVLCCAPTGKASRRMTESTGMPAFTLHKKLEITADNMEPSNLNASIVVVDETSMLDTEVANALFKAVLPGTKLILVGDIDQLPSVGAGAVLRDMIESGVVPTNMLTKTFRQKGESLIIDNAKNIKDGITKIDVNSEFLICSTAEAKAYGYNSEEYLVNAYLSKVAQYGVENVALLTPYKKEKFATGADHLNKVIQARYNPDGEGIKYKGTVFREGDRVMQLENRRECANGDVGTISKVTNKYITIEYIDGSVDYTSDELNQLTLAYALSVHKSQGSEYKAVISCMLNEHSAMQKRNLLYTAVTRAKKDFILLYDYDALKKCIETDATNSRKTNLKERLVQVAKFKNLAYKADTQRKEAV